jgi:hypothetical protein
MLYPRDSMKKTDGKISVLSVHFLHGGTWLPSFAAKDKKVMKE